MVDDLQDVRLLQAGHRLGRLVVVHQHHLLPPGADQMVAGQGAHHPVLAVQNGIAAVAALQDHLLDVVDVVREVEGGNALPLGQPPHGDGLEDPADGAVAVVGGGDNAGAPRGLPQVVWQLRLAQNDAGHAERHRPAEHVRLVAADEDGVLLPEGGQLRGLGQGQDHLAGNGVDHLRRLPQGLSLQDAEDVEQGHLLQPGGLDGPHVIGGDVPGGHHAPQAALLVGDGHGGDMGVLLHSGPGPAHGHRLVEDGGHVVVQVLDLGAHALDQGGGLEAEAAEDQPRLVADVAQPGGDVLPVPGGVAQGGVGHRGDDGIRVRIPVAGNINLLHFSGSFSRPCGAGAFLPPRRRRGVLFACAKRTKSTLKGRSVP